MRVAIIGAGVVGVASAYECAADGHEVVVFERRNAVAAETSFANAGVVAPGAVGPWASPSMPWKVLSQRFSRHAAVRFGSWDVLRQLPWLWRWWRACSAQRHRSNRAAMQQLARHSQQRLESLSGTLGLDFEQTRGYLVLMRSARELDTARSSLPALAEAGIAHELVDAARVRALEPGLNPQTGLAGALHLPDALVGNCRQFTHLLKARAQVLGAQFRFGQTVRSVQPGRPVRVRVETAGEKAGRMPDGEFDAVVLCAGVESNSVLRPHGLELPLAAVHGYSFTAPLRLLESQAVGPCAALMDERFKVAISRLGQRVRVAGSAELGGSLQANNPRALATLYRVLDDWFPGAAQLRDVQVWKGARPMLPDGPPVVGPSGADGVWLNLGHGSSGWALACGSARVLADRMAGREPGLDVSRLGVERLRR